nr:MAG: hypothetical protein [Bacteriophage sp.]
MTKYQQIEKQTKDTKRHIKRCTKAQQWERFGFDVPIVNGQGMCGGCYNADDRTLEPECGKCPYNEYFIEAESGAMQYGA